MGATRVATKRELIRHISLPQNSYATLTKIKKFITTEMMCYCKNHSLYTEEELAQSSPLEENELGIKTPLIEMEM
jgi:hypothetical protein